MSRLDEAETLRLTASLEQASGHSLARAIVGEARDRNLTLARPTEVEEMPGEGISSLVEGRRIVAGGPHMMRSHAIRFPPAEVDPGRATTSATVIVAVDGAAAAILTFADPLRTDGAQALAEFRACGIERIVLATGDRRAVAESLAAGLPIDVVAAGLDRPPRCGSSRTSDRTHPS